MHVESPRYENKLHAAFFRGAQEAGIPRNSNFNDWGHAQVRAEGNLSEAWKEEFTRQQGAWRCFQKHRTCSSNSSRRGAFHEQQADLLLVLVAGLVICPAVRQEGYGEFQVCQERGVRADTHRQYLKPVAGRGNLTVVTKAKTLRVEFEEGRGQPVARGVTFTVNGPDGPRHTGMNALQHHRLPSSARFTSQPRLLHRCSLEHDSRLCWGARKGMACWLAGCV